MSSKRGFEAVPIEVLPNQQTDEIMQPHSNSTSGYWGRIRLALVVFLLVCNFLFVMQFYFRTPPATGGSLPLPLDQSHAHQPNDRQMAVAHEILSNHSQALHPNTSSADDTGSPAGSDASTVGLDAPTNSTVGSADDASDQSPPPPPPPEPCPNKASSPDPSPLSCSCPRCYFPPPSLLPPLPSTYFGERYLMFRVGNRFHNHRESLFMALVFARFTNRTLIIPHHIDLNRMFDFYRLSQLHPIVSEVDLPNHYKDDWGGNKDEALIGEDSHTWQILWYVSRQDLLRSPEQMQWLGANELHSLVSARFEPHFLNEELGPLSASWKLPLLKVDHTWGTLSSLLAGLSLPLIRGIRKFVMSALPYNYELYTLAHRVVSQLPQDFIGIHWRLDDFTRDKGRLQYVLTIDKVMKFLRESCGVTKDSGRVVYVASDSPTHGILSEFAKVAEEELGVQVVQWSKFTDRFVPFEHWGFYDEYMLADKGLVSGIVEMLILAHSTNFLGTPLSTFSEAVFQLMRHIGHDEKAAIMAAVMYAEQSGFTQQPFADEVRPKQFKPPIKHSQESEMTLEMFTHQL